MNLDKLNLPSDKIKVLVKNGWTVDRLATASVQKLTVIPGIGKSTAEAAIRAARDVVNTEKLKESKKIEYMSLPEVPAQRSVRVRRIYGEVI